jgi:hypothetical protein
MFIDSLPDAPSATPYTRRFDYDGSGNLIYEGWARAQGNPASSSPVWAIKKYTYTSGNITLAQWASGNSAEKQIWDNRAALSYQ